MPKEITHTEEAVRILREFKDTEGERFGIETLALVGSTARGEQTEEPFVQAALRDLVARGAYLEKLFA